MTAQIEPTETICCSDCNKDSFIQAALLECASDGMLRPVHEPPDEREKAIDELHLKGFVANPDIKDAWICQECIYKRPLKYHCEYCNKQELGTITNLPTGWIQDDELGFIVCHNCL